MRFAKQQRRKVNRRNRQSGTPWINDADGAFYRHEQRSARLFLKSCANGGPCCNSEPTTPNT
jgi:hypothetical protein